MFLETVDPRKVGQLLKSIDLHDAQFVIISKSGNTIEPISLLKHIDSLITIDSSNCTIISEAKSLLSQFAENNNIKAFYLDENVGGRFSVFSEVGLIPLAMIGADIDSLLDGCKQVSDRRGDRDAKVT